MANTPDADPTFAPEPDESAASDAASVGVGEEAAASSRASLVQLAVLVAAGVVGTLLLSVILTPQRAVLTDPGSPMKLTEHEVALTPDSYETVMASGKPVLVDFSATWCGPCMQAKPEVEELAADMQNELVVAVADMSAAKPAASPIARAWGVSGYPTFVLIKDNTEVARSVGMPYGSLEDWVREHLSP